jgi:hypothetical protein
MTGRTSGGNSRKDSPKERDTLVSKTCKDRGREAGEGMALILSGYCTWLSGVVY